MRILSFALILLLPVSAIAQMKLYPDPYAQDMVDYANARYRQAKTLSRDEVFDAWFAQGCEVITEQGAKALTTNYVKTFTVENHVMSEYDPQLPKVYTDATSDGKVQAKVAGACQYWHSHPELVIKLRGDSGWTDPR